MAMRPVVVVLAAGRGSRFRGEHHKLEQTINGVAMLGHVLRHALASLLPLVVVTTEAIAPLARRTVASRDVLVLDGDMPIGMGHSIAAGVAARPHASGWLVLPGDMPLVRPSTLLAVASALATHRTVVVAHHRGRRGHPVGFGAELYSELIALDGDDGARRLLARYPMHEVEVADPGVLVDVDTRADLEGLLRSESALPDEVRRDDVAG